VVAWPRNNVIPQVVLFDDAGLSILSEHRVAATTESVRNSQDTAAKSSTTPLSSAVHFVPSVELLS